MMRAPPATLRSDELTRFPRLHASVQEFVQQAQWAKRQVQSAYLFGSFLRHALTGIEPFGDIDVAPGSDEDAAKLRSLQHQPVLVFDYTRRARRYVPVEVLRRSWFGPAHLLRFLQDVTVSGAVYSFADNKLWYTAAAWEALASRVIEPNDDLHDDSPLRILCRTFTYVSRGYRCSPEAVAAVLERYRRQSAIRRWGAELWMRRTYRDRLVLTPRSTLT